MPRLTCMLPLWLLLSQQQPVLQLRAVRDQQLRAALLSRMYRQRRK